MNERKTTTVKDEQGRQVYASTGAVNQHGGSRPVRRCGTCGAEVVWAESQKTGQHYLVNVSTGYNGQRFYMGHNLHRSTCERIMADRAASIARAVGTRHAEIRGAHKRGEILAEEMLERLQILADKLDATSKEGT